MKLEETNSKPTSPASTEIREDDKLYEKREI